jgi:hypothetical protein
MKFDPTFDYGSTDMNIDKNLICWKFGELIKNLYTLASDANIQREIIGIGAASDEMTEDFHRYFTLSYKNYINYGLLNDTTVDKLRQLDAFFDERSGRESEFWDDTMLGTNAEWVIVREKAKEIIQLLGMQGLSLGYNRNEETHSENRVVSQGTKIRLVKSSI